MANEKRGRNFKDDAEWLSGERHKCPAQGCRFWTDTILRGKRGRKVAVLLSPDMVKAITCLIEKRKDCGVLAENLFLFARPHCLTPYRGQDCLRLYASECGAENPELLRSTQLRKHVATLSQILNLKNHELDQVADFLGHDIRIHREYYRLPEATSQLAKISKLLLAMEKGSLRSLQGKTLDEIEIEVQRVRLMQSEVDAERAVDEGNLTYPQTGSAGLIARQPVEEHPGMSAPLSQEPSRKQKKKEKEPSRKLEDKEPSRKKKTNEQSVSLESARSAKKHQWSPMEVAMIMRHFGKHIKKGKLATMIECQQCKLAEDPALAGRSILNIRDFARNRGVTLKRKDNPG
ncbi:hypothetical protein N1851_006748 [Merluccius polli]|uniref:Uncharacterized protein n=1 Tax=Merluccius polli TaxID=89951 RepID=A0AA47N3T1_MERPO|nr:hypothetical protein N1851_006748 [Merluccius polli]